MTNRFMSGTTARYRPFHTVKSDIMQRKPYYRKKNGRFIAEITP